MKRIGFFVVVLVLVLLAVPLVVSAQDEGTTQAAYEAVLSAEPMYGVIESEVEIERDGQMIRGTLALPDGTDGPYPIVLLLHGFTGSRNELPILGVEGDFFYARTARMLAEQGFASLRIDFIGSGESDGEWAETTFSSQIADAQAAVDYLPNLDGIDPERIGIIGLSQGGLVASAVAGSGSPVDSVVLWSPVAVPAATYPEILGQRCFSLGLVSEQVTCLLPWAAYTTLNQPFFQDVFNVDPIAEISHYEGPLMVVAGLRDATVAPQPYMSELYINNHDGAEMLVTVDGEHVFDVLVPEAGATVLDDVIAWSLAWLTQTL